MSWTITRDRVAPATGAGRSTSLFRADIEGLRAVAVLLVIANHLVGWPTGGFVGVDVFFVVSGFLITGLLLREKQQTGTVSFREFYARRMRRIFPMATVVLVVTVILAYLLYLSDQAEQTMLDALWAFVFLENWHLAAVGTDYFHLADGASPVQQYWSLSVEEQFYVVWPAMLWAVWVASRRWLPDEWHHVKRLRLAPAMVLAGLIAASFGWAVHQTATHPTHAYFSTFTRAWELAAGALLAVVAPLLTRLPTRVRAPLAYVGLLMIGTGALLLTDTSAFPGPWALLPVLGALVVIAAGTGGAQPSVALLHNRGAQAVGRLSYSLYLWHFPVIAFLSVLVAPGLVSYLLALALTFGLSVVSYYRIEDPIRRSDWLSRRTATAPAEPAWSAVPTDAPPTQSWRRRALNVATVAVLVSALLLVVQYNVKQRLGPAPAAAPATSQVVDLAAPASGSGDGVGAFEVVFPDAQGILSAHLQAATTATAWPVLQQPEMWDDWSLAVNAGNCTTGFVEARYCIFETPGATKTAVLFGDSHIAAWFPALRPALEEAGYRIEVYYLVGCPVAAVPIHRHTASAPQNLECEDFRADAIARVAAASPDLTVVSSFWRQVELSMSGATGAQAEQEWQDGMVRVLGEVAPHTRDVLVLDSPPGAESLKKCRTAVAAPQDCQRPIQEWGAAMSRVNARAVAAVHATHPQVRHRAVEDWFCADGVCPAFMADLPIYTDGIHLAPGYATFLQPVVKGAVTG